MKIWAGLRLSLIVGLVWATPFSWGSVVQTPSWKKTYHRPYALDLIQFQMGPLCKTLTLPQGSLPCHPGDLGAPERRNQSFFSLNGYLSGDIPEVENFERYLSANKSLELIESLFYKKRIVSAQVGTGLQGQHNQFGYAIGPVELSYFSVARSDSNPRLAVQLMRRHSLRFDWGEEIHPNVLFGLSLRGEHRRFVQEDLFLLEALSQPGQHLQPREQNSLFLDPAIKVRSQDWGWPVSFSVSLSQLGLTDQRYEEAKPIPSFNVGSAVKVPVSRGDLELAYSISRPPIGRHRWGDWALGAVYAVEKLYTYAVLEDYRWAIGGQLRFDSLLLGLSFDQERLRYFSQGSNFRDHSNRFSLSAALSF